MSKPQHWMHRDRAAKPLSLSAQLARLKTRCSDLERALSMARQNAHDKGVALREADKWRDKLMDQVSVLEVERDALLKRLRGLEWIEEPYGHELKDGPWCPECHELESDGHYPACDYQGVLAAWRAADGG